MSIYADLTVEQLNEEITKLRVALRSTDSSVRVVAGEGRRLEYGNKSPTDLRALYRAALEEQEARTGRGGGSAIGVRF